MPVIDSQIHIWAADRPERPWPKAGTNGRNATPNRPVPLGCEEIVGEMKAAGVDGAVLIPPSWEGDYNDVALAAVKEHPSRFRIMGRIAADDAQGPAKLGQWKQQPGMLGIRVLLEPGSAWPDAGCEHWLWAAAEHAGVVITIATRGYFDLIESIAQRHPLLRISLDHMGTDWAKTDAAAFARIEEVLALARYPNIAVKASMLPALSSAPYPFRSVEPYLKAVFSAYGPERTFWGSNLSRLSCPYRQAVTMFTEELVWLKGADLDLVMGRALCAWIGWDEATQRAPVKAGAA